MHWDFGRRLSLAGNPFLLARGWPETDISMPSSIPPACIGLIPSCRLGPYRLARFLTHGSDLGGFPIQLGLEWKGSCSLHKALEMGTSNQFRIKEQGDLFPLQQAGNRKNKGPLQLVSLSSKA